MQKYNYFPLKLEKVAQNGAAGTRAFSVAPRCRETVTVTSKRGGDRLTMRAVSNSIAPYSVIPGNGTYSITAGQGDDETAADTPDTRQPPGPTPAQKR